jgi:hypothetical protein
MNLAAIGVVVPIFYSIKDSNFGPPMVCLWRLGWAYLGIRVLLRVDRGEFKYCLCHFQLFHLMHVTFSVQQLAYSHSREEQFQPHRMAGKIKRGNTFKT